MDREKRETARSLHICKSKPEPFCSLRFHLDIIGHAYHIRVTLTRKKPDLMPLLRPLLYSVVNYINKL